MNDFINKIQLVALELFPRELFSSSLNKFANLHLPEKIKNTLFEAFVKINGINMAESEHPLTYYQTLDELFTRKLIKELRPVDKSENSVVSPVDGKVQNFGKITGGRLIQAKNIDYPLSTLLNDKEKSDYFKNGNFLTLYLSPSDYHRIHFPLSGRVTSYTHIPGVSYPVGSFSVNNIPSLYTVNERIITYVSTKRGDYALILVAAMGVGNMTLSYTADRNRITSGEKNLDIPVSKGDEAGIFHLGSTVIILTPEGFADFEVTSGQKCRFGQKIGFLL